MRKCLVFLLTAPVALASCRDAALTPVSSSDDGAPTSARTLGALQLAGPTSDSRTDQVFELRPRFVSPESSVLAPGFVIEATPAALLIRQQFDEARREFVLYVRIRNNAVASIDRAIRARVCGIAPNEIQIANADNGELGTSAVWDYSQQLGEDGSLGSRELSSDRMMTFRLPQELPLHALRDFRLCLAFSWESSSAFPATVRRTPSDGEITSGKGIGMVAVLYRNAPTAIDLGRINTRYSLRGQWFDQELWWYVAFTPDTTAATTEAMAQILAADPEVAAAEPIPIALGTATPSVELRNNALASTNFPAAWQADDASGRVPGAGVVVGFLDTGIDATHAELTGQILGAVDARVFGNDPSDRFGHGTSVAGVIAAKFNDQFAVGGAYGARLVSIKVADARPNAVNFGIYAYDAIRGLKQAASTPGLDVVNISWGIPWFAYVASPLLFLTMRTIGDQHLQQIMSNGAVVVASAGNIGECNTPTGGVIWPARSPGVVAVAGVAATSFSFLTSCAGPEVALAAPYEVPSIKPAIQSPGWIIFSGTSASAPLVAAGVAVIKARSPSPKPSGTALRTELLTRNVKDISSTCPNGCGAGRLFVSVSSTTNFKSLTAGGKHTCGLTTSGTAYCWGWNSSGQLGDGTTVNSNLPTAVAGGLVFAELDAGHDHTCGRTPTGVAYCWGANAEAQIGDGTTTTRTVPTRVLGGLLFSAISAGQSFTCALATGGKMYCWGWNTTGQLGDGTLVMRSSPTAVSGNITFGVVTAGYAHTCGSTIAGTVYCWGWGGMGQLGIGATPGQHPIPTALVFPPAAIIPEFSSVIAGYEHTCALTSVGTYPRAGDLYCWGQNFGGQLGDGTTFQRSIPNFIAGFFNFVTLAPGYLHTCAARSSGEAYCWGANHAGALGDGTTFNRLQITRVSGTHNFAMLAAGHDHTCGLTTTGAAYCWGEGALGQIGDGTNARRLVPTAVR